MSRQRKPLSHAWKTVLKKLSEYGEMGVREDTLIELLDGKKYSYRSEAKGVLSQMFFLGKQYYEHHPENRDIIRITPAGLDALENGELP